MAQVEGLHLRGSRWHLRVIIPKDLHPLYGGKGRVSVALDTSNRREAVLAATAKRAAWLAEFEAKRAALAPMEIAAVTPELAQTLADMVRAKVLGEDERFRSDVEHVALVVRDLKEWRRLRAGIPPAPQGPPRENHRDTLEGLTDEEAAEVSRINAILDSDAAKALAAGNLSRVLPLAKEMAARLGVAFDPSTPGAREALRLCLRAYRTAHQEATRRDAGEWIETPAISTTPPKKPENPKTLRDAFDKWKVSLGDKGEARSKDSIQTAERAVRRFETKHPSVTMPEVTRAMGDEYRSWLLANLKTSKTARDMFIYTRALLEHAANVLEWIPRNPWGGLDLASKVTAKRRAMTEAEIISLFSTPLHTQYALPQSIQAAQDAAYWIPLMGLYTGARLGELCKMRPADVLLSGAIPALQLTNEAEGAGTKTEAGNRIFPIHSELIRLGFIGYAKAMQKAGHASLWPSMKMRKDKPSDYFGRWFRDFSANIEPTFHYFRHTVRPLMRQAGIDAKERDRVTGHDSGGSVGDVVYDAVRLGELVPAVAAIRYPFLRLPVVSPHAA